MKSKKLFSLILTLVLLVALSATIFGSDIIRKQIQVAYRNISLVVDGQKVPLGKDTSGNKIEPFIHNGTTYLPVRAVAEALGEDVEWDGKTSTIYVGKRLDKETFDRLNDDVKYMSSAGKTTYWNDKGGKTVYDIASNRYSYYMYADIYSGESNYIAYPINSEYKNFKAKLGWISKAKSNHKDGVVTIYLDGEKVKSFVLKAGDFTRDISVDVSGALKLEIQFENTDYITLFDPILVK